MTRRSSHLLFARELAPIGLAAVVLLWAAMAGASSGLANGKNSKNSTGSYKVQFGGYAKGSGSASVGPANLTITGTVTSEGGKKQNFQATLTLENNRFFGDGTLDGVPVSVSGRVDPPDATLKVGRLSGLYRTVDGQVGRISGSQSPSQGKGNDGG